MNGRDKAMTIANVITPPPGAYGTDLNANAQTVIAPAATTSITLLAMTAKEKPATWRVRVRYGFTAGAPAAADANNWRVVYQSTVLIQALVCFPAVMTLENQYNLQEFIFNDGGISGTLAIQSIGAGTAGVAYTADMQITRLS
jgi:hypothetical protein